MKILIIEDNHILSNNIAKYLELENIITKQLFEGEKVCLEIVGNNYDLIILDLGLPDFDGIELCKKIRDIRKSIPILMLTARNTIKSKILGLNSGADDYLTKPFDYEELIARINALVRRNFSIKSNKILLGEKNSIEINIEKKEVKINNNKIHLSKLETDLLIFLAQNKGKLITKEVLLEKVWGEYDDFKVTRTVDVYIGYLRKKIDKNLIKTVRGKGYIIN